MHGVAVLIFTICLASECGIMPLQIDVDESCHTWQHEARMALIDFNQLFPHCEHTCGIQKRR
jgi:hypothetical protein